jgi:hypothetical protein
MSMSLELSRKANSCPNPGLWLRNKPPVTPKLSRWTSRTKEHSGCPVWQCPQNQVVRLCWLLLKSGLLLENNSVSYMSISYLFHQPYALYLKASHNNQPTGHSSTGKWGHDLPLSCAPSFPLLMISQSLSTMLLWTHVLLSLASGSVQEKNLSGFCPYLCSSWWASRSGAEVHPHPLPLTKQASDSVLLILWNSNFYCFLCPQHRVRLSWF